MPRHPFHIVDVRPWPLIIALNVFCLATGLVRWFHEKSLFLVGVSVFNLLLIIAL